MMNENQIRMIKLLNEIKEQFYIVKDNKTELLKLASVWEDLTGRDCGGIDCRDCPLDDSDGYSICCQLDSMKEEEVDCDE